MLYNLPKILLKESEQGVMIVRHILALIQKCSANTLHTYLIATRFVLTNLGQRAKFTPEEIFLICRILIQPPVYFYLALQYIKFLHISLAKLCACVCVYSNLYIIYL